MASLLDELLAAIRAAPEDDAPRLVYADALMARGEAHGELIALQIAAFRGSLEEAGRARLDELERDHAALARWSPELSRAGQIAYRRGFPEAIYLGERAADLVGEPACATLCTIQNLGVPPKDVAFALLDQPSCARVRAVYDLPVAWFEELAATPRTWRTVGLSGERAPSADSLDALPEDANVELKIHAERIAGGDYERLTRLAKLSLAYTSGARALVLPPRLRSLALEAPFDDDVAPDFLFPAGCGVEQLRLYGFCALRDAGLAPFASVTDLNLSFERPLRAGTLDPLGGLTELHLVTRHSLSPAFVPALPALVTLYVGDRCDGNAPLPELSALERLRWSFLPLACVPHGLPRLRHAELECPIDLADIATFAARHPALETLELDSRRFVTLDPDEVWRALEAALAASAVQGITLRAQQQVRGTFRLDRTGGRSGSATEAS